jgi:hypothetical protein
MKNWNKICGFIVIFFLPVLFCAAQSAGIGIPGQKLNVAQSHFPGINNRDYYHVSYPSSFYITPDYAKEHFGFFCKKELLVEKYTKIPLRFRLGSVEQCNYLEGYLNATLNGQ